MRLMYWVYTFTRGTGLLSLHRTVISIYLVKIEGLDSLQRFEIG
jgi:hypothetical protein